MRLTLFFVLGLSFFVGACDDTTTTPPAADMSVNVTGSICGHPGDVGNDKGVGKFCIQQGECAGNGSATICSTALPRNTYFCTKPCDPATSPADFCGTNASCICDPAGAGCGCTPKSCNIGMPG